MLQFNEYIPAGGWLKFNKRKAFKRRLCRFVCVALACALLVVFYALVGYIERGF